MVDLFAFDNSLNVQSVPSTGTTKAVTCYYVHVIMQIKDPELSVVQVRVGHRVLLAGFCLPLFNLHLLNRDINNFQTNQTNIVTF